MNLKIVTLIAAITQLLAFLASATWFVKYVTDSPLRDNLHYALTQPIFLLAEGMMAMFLFVLHSRQKG